MLADHGAFNATAQPSRYPAGFFSVFTGSYDVAAAHCRVTGVYTNKAPGGVAYSCSFRIAEAVYLVERSSTAWPASWRSIRSRCGWRTCCGPEQFPYESKTGWVYDSGDYERGAAHGAGARRLRRAAPRAGRAAGARRADGHRRLVLHRGGRRRPAQAHGHARAGDERRRGAARAPDRHGAARDQRADPGPGPRDDVRPDRRPTSSASRPTTSRSCTATPTRRRTGSARTARARRRSAARPPRWPRARCASAPGSSPRAMLEVAPEDLEWDARALGRAWATRTQARRRSRRSRWPPAGRSSCPTGVEAGLDAEAVYDPPNLTFPFGAYVCVVDVDPGTATVKVRRFIAVDDCGMRINPMIVEGQIHGGLADGVGIALMETIAFDEDGNCLGGSLMDYLIPTALEVPDWETGYTVTPSPHHPIGAKGVGECGDRRLPAGDRQRDLRRPRRPPRRHAVHPVPGVGGDEPMITGDLVSRHAAAARRPRAVRHRDRRARGQADERAAGRLARSSLADGTIEGFVGGLCAQASVRLYAARALETGEPCCCGCCPTPAPDSEGGDGVVVAAQPVPERRGAGDLPRAAAGRAARSSWPATRRSPARSRRSARAAGYDVARGRRRARPTTRRSSSPRTGRRGGGAGGRARGGRAVRRARGQPPARRGRRRVARRARRRCARRSTRRPASTSAPARRATSPIAILAELIGERRAHAPAAGADAHRDRPGVRHGGRSSPTRHRPPRRRRRARLLLLRGLPLHLCRRALVAPAGSTTHSGGPRPPLPGGGRRARTASMRAATAAGSDDRCSRRVMRRPSGRDH